MRLPSPYLPARTKTPGRAIAGPFTLAAIGLAAFAGTATAQDIRADETPPEREIAEVAAPHDNFLSLSTTPMLQHSARSGGTNANNEVDIVGQLELREAGDGVLGQLRLSFWWLHNATLGGSLSTSEFSERAGLLWDVNDGDAPDPADSLGLIALHQDFRFNETLATLSAGKLYPGNDLATSPYFGDDRDTFFNQIMSGEPVGRWHDRIGLGAGLKIDSDRWFANLMITDATAQEAYFDVSSIKDGSNFYAGEAGAKIRSGLGATRAGVLAYRIDRTQDLTAERGLVVTATHEFGSEAVDGSGPVALFARLSARDGGEARPPGPSDQTHPLRWGWLAGMALNEPFGRDDQQIGVAVFQGAPTSKYRAKGFSSQTGLEIYWKFTPHPAIAITPDLQLLQTRDDRLDAVFGLRVRLGHEFRWQ